METPCWWSIPNSFFLALESMQQGETGHFRPQEVPKTACIEQTSHKLPTRIENYGGRRENPSKNILSIHWFRRENLRNQTSIFLLDI